MNLFSFIKQRLPILEVVSEYATLKKAGLYWKGCCPFHHERTPSFTVSPHKEIFYCFGCQAGGDVISFISKIEHCSALEAARHLTERYKIPIPQEITWEKSSDDEDAKKLYYQTCTVFAQWTADQLEKYRAAYDYVIDRGIKKESIKDFTLGYCPHQIKSLLTYAQKEGILAQNLIDAHILLEGKLGLYSPFEERIIFPIRDHLGRFVGFGGRVYKPGDERAKYYNSHEHALFNKGSLLFGLDRSKKEIAKKEAAFLVEGYTDLIMMHQSGFTNTVATLGTACTPEHLKQLARYAQRLYVLYDGDTAGQNAIMRLVELCWQVAIDPYVVTLPASDDPATFLVKGGDLHEKVAQAHDIFSFVVQHMAENFSQRSLSERLTVSKKIVALINSITDPLKRDLLLKQASDAFSIPIETLHQGVALDPLNKRAIKHTDYSMPSARTKHTDYSMPSARTQETENNISQLEKNIFSGILNTRVTLSQEDSELLSVLLDKPLRKLFDALIRCKKEQEIDTLTLFEELNEEEKALIAQALVHEETSSQIARARFEELLAQFYKKQWKKVVADVKLRIQRAQQQGETEQVKTLLLDLDALKKKMLRRGTI